MYQQSIDYKFLVNL